jgi:polysaccharide pyruvyl transferase WcaK-like protein
MTSDQAAVALFGAPARTGNLGVAALLCATVDALRHRGVESVFVFGDHDHSDPGQPGFIPAIGAVEVPARWSRRIWSHASMGNLYMRARFGLNGRRGTPSRVLAEACAGLDISGGDSFTDMYGEWRYRWVLRAKEAVLAKDKPLILLPQTYGPFIRPESRERASRIVRAASVAWARDERSFAVLRELLDESFDPQRHRCGVDVAFLLPTERPPDAVLDRLGPLMTPVDQRRHPVFGLNVSGLIWKDPDRARSAFRFKADYNAATTSLISRMLDETDAAVALMPHVVTPTGHFESDLDASNELRERVLADRPSCAERLIVVPAVDDPRHAKWIISRFDWFCGTRMHATIAGLSSGIPTAAISYSPKTLGVFESCGMGAHVADPTTTDASDIVEHLMSSVHERESSRRVLVGALPRVIAKANEQFDHIVSAIHAPVDT